MSVRKTDVLDILHTNQQYVKRSKRFLIWMPVNIILLAVVIYDLWKYQRRSTWLTVTEHLIAIISSLNVVYWSMQGLLIQYFPKRFQVSFQQFSLLQRINGRIFNENCTVDVLLKGNEQTNKTKNKKFNFENFQASSSSLFANNTSTKSESLSENIKEKYPIKRHRTSSSFANVHVLSDAHDTSVMSSLDGYSAGCGDISSSLMSNSLSRIMHNSVKNTFFNDEMTDEVDAMRRCIQITDYPQISNFSDSDDYWRRNDGSFFRSHQSRKSYEVVLNDVYQLSSTTALEYVKPVNEVSSLGANPTICKKFGINQAFLSEWIANLRMWITQTILTRVIKEIEEVNQALTLQGITNVSIGSSGLERLKKTAAMSQVYQNIPSFSSLISFLDISLNQEYVVQRISALSTGSMSNYCWNAGGSYEGKPWNESLPTDAALVMHLVAAYFDSQLLPLPHTAPDGRQFSSAHYSRRPAELKRSQSSLMIYQHTIHPPHFQLIIGDETYDISRGRNNLFHVILFLLHHIKTKESGMFEHVNLGSSGINMLWIISDPSNNLYKKM